MCAGGVRTEQQHRSAVARNTCLKLERRHRDFGASPELAPSPTSSHHVGAGGSGGGRASGSQPWCLGMGFAEAASPGLSGAGAAPGRSWRLSLLPSRCCSRPVGVRCPRHRRRCCPLTLPPFDTFRAAKHGVGWTGRARAPREGRRVCPPCHPRSRLSGPGKAGLARRGHRPRARRGRAGGCPRVSPSIPGARPAPSGTILVGVASWVFTVKAARLSLLGVSPGYLCTCVCLYRFKKTQPSGDAEGSGLHALPPAAYLPSTGCVTASDVFQLATSPLPFAGSTSEPGPASPRPARRPPSYKETSRCRRPSRSAPRLSSHPAPAAPARSQRRDRGERGAAEPPGSPASPGTALPGPGREAGWAVRAPRLPPVGASPVAVGT